MEQSTSSYQHRQLKERKKKRAKIDEAEARHAGVRTLKTHKPVERMRGASLEQCARVRTPPACRLNVCLLGPPTGEEALALLTTASCALARRGVPVAFTTALPAAVVAAVMRMRRERARGCIGAYGYSANASTSKRAGVRGVLVKSCPAVRELTITTLFFKSSDDPGRFSFSLFSVCRCSAAFMQWA